MVNNERNDIDQKGTASRPSVLEEGEAESRQLVDNNNNQTSTKTTTSWSRKWIVFLLLAIAIAIVLAGTAIELTVGFVRRNKDSSRSISSCHPNQEEEEEDSTFSSFGVSQKLPKNNNTHLKK